MQNKVTSKRVKREMLNHPGIGTLLIPVLLRDLATWTEVRRNDLLAHLVQSCSFEFRDSDLEGLDVHVRFLWLVVSACMGAKEFGGSKLYEHLKNHESALIANYLYGIAFVQRFDKLFAPLLRHYKN